MPFCPSCGKEVDESVLYCPRCGHSINPVSQATSQPPALAAPMTGGGEKKHRPLGVTIIAVLDAIAGLLLLLRGGAYFGIRSMMGSAGGPLGSYRGLFAGLGLLFVLVGLVTIFLAWGLWSGFGWAWTAALILAVLGLVLHLLSFNIIGLIINVAVLVYLLVPNVRAYFGH